MRRIGKKKTYPYFHDNQRVSFTSDGKTREGYILSRITPEFKNEKPVYRIIDVNYDSYKSISASVFIVNVEHIQEIPGAKDFDWQEKIALIQKSPSLRF